jgi:hypothetical protein
MAKIKLRNVRDDKDEERIREGNRLIGKAIFNAWDQAYKNNPKNPEIDRRALIASLSQILDLEDKGRSGKTIEFDVVFDTDLDANTRLVWISVPTPETEGVGGRTTWAEWKRDYYDNLSQSEKDDKEEKLGNAMLFGCGR